MPGQHLPFHSLPNLCILVFISSEIPHSGINLINSCNMVTKSCVSFVFQLEWWLVYVEPGLKFIYRRHIWWDTSRRVGSCYFAGSRTICHFGVIPSFCAFAVGGCYYWISFILHLGGSCNWILWCYCWRFCTLKSSFKLEHKRTTTTLSDHIWKLKKKNTDSKLNGRL